MKTVLGLDRIGEFASMFKGKRIGLITNSSGVDSRWRTNVEVFTDAGFAITRIFTPEHGMYGKRAARPVEDDVYPGYAIPMVSLFGKKQRPEAGQLQDLDLLVYDIQDVGLRYYTYIYTMTYCMEAAAQQGIPFVVLDRSNPLGNRIISGGRIRPELRSFIGDYELPVRYGLTCGELGRYFLRNKGISMDYRVIAMEHYTRDMYYSDTGQLWNIPSPALTDFESTICYCGGCFAGATSLSDGRGSPEPFRMYGAPYVDMRRLYQEMKREAAQEDVVFRERAFIPTEGVYQGQVCFGLEFAPLRKDLDFLPTALTLLRQTARMYPEAFTLRDGEAGEKHLSYQTGSWKTEQYLKGAVTRKELLEEWETQSAAFAKEAEPVRIYTSREEEHHEIIYDR